jgi:hypothetical protein
LIFLTPLEKAATYIPREIAEKLEKDEAGAKSTSESDQ